MHGPIFAGSKEKKDEIETETPNEKAKACIKLPFQTR